MQAASTVGITEHTAMAMTSAEQRFVDVIGADMCRVIMWVFLSKVRMKPEPSGSITMRADYVTLLHN